NAGRDEFVLDVRGTIKPNLDPARHPRGSSVMDADETWKHLQSLTDKARGLLWEKILSDFGGQQTVDAFWQHLIFHGVNPAKMRAGVIWSKLLFPFCDDAGKVEWKRLEEVKRIWFDDDLLKGCRV